MHPSPFRRGAGGEASMPCKPKLLHSSRFLIGMPRCGFAMRNLYSSAREIKVSYIYAPLSFSERGRGGGLDAVQAQVASLVPIFHRDAPVRVCNAQPILLRPRNKGILHLCTPLLFGEGPGGRPRCRASPSCFTRPDFSSGCTGAGLQCATYTPPPEK